ncbi:rod shape-determining protein MreC [Larsenimonas sp. GH2-1]|uniref:Cell shape-determining protein MreC n=1 Tax=Larsenimonas rhizosphaerae TaxID=2944682 RepID=A0AA41ZMV3_9GAMM|nr:rod shape-determining protein MreC [Larsenimonas rhizosphaerae]
MKPLFLEGPVPGYRMMLCAVLALVLMFADHRFQWMSQVRQQSATLVAPVQWFVSQPSRGLTWLSTVLSSKNDLIDDNQALRNQLLILSQRNQRMASLVEENSRLRDLLNATPRGHISWVASELMMLDNDPFVQQMIVDRGHDDGIYEGQPVVDASGLTGQVIAVSRFTSRVLLITDANSAVPVQDNRTGLRFIIQGNGQNVSLELLHVPNNADVREGDLLVTSGLASRFPEGYPVARVTRIQPDDGGPFATVEAAPVARLERSRHFLMLFAREALKDIPDVSDEAITVSRHLQGLEPLKDRQEVSDAP